MCRGSCFIVVTIASLFVDCSPVFSFFACDIAVVIAAAIANVFVAAVVVVVASDFMLL